MASPCGMLGRVVTNLDVEIFRALHHALSGRITLAIMAVLTLVGSGWPLLLLAPFLARSTTRRLCLFVLGVASTTTISVFALKHVVSRLRPCVCLADVHARIFAAPTDYSFPSGHSAGAFAMASFAVYVLWSTPSSSEASPLRRPVARLTLSLVLFALAIGVALSRIALGVHFPTDLLAGAVLGTLVGTTGARLYERTRAVSS